MLTKRLKRITSLSLVFVFCFSQAAYAAVPSSLYNALLTTGGIIGMGGTNYTPSGYVNTQNGVLPMYSSLYNKTMLQEIGNALICKLTKTCTYSGSLSDNIKAKYADILTQSGLNPSYPTYTTPGYNPYSQYPNSTQYPYQNPYQVGQVQTQPATGQTSLAGGAVEQQSGTSGALPQYSFKDESGNAKFGDMPLTTTGGVLASSQGSRTASGRATGGAVITSENSVPISGERVSSSSETVGSGGKFKELSNETDGCLIVKPAVSPNNPIVGDVVGINIQAKWGSASCKPASATILGVKVPIDKWILVEQKATIGKKSVDYTVTTASGKKVTGNIRYTVTEFATYGDDKTAGTDYDKIQGQGQNGSVNGQADSLLRKFEADKAAMGLSGDVPTTDEEPGSGYSDANTRNLSGFDPDSVENENNYVAEESGNQNPADTAQARAEAICQQRFAGANMALHGAGYARCVEMNRKTAEKQIAKESGRTTSSDSDSGPAEPAGGASLEERGKAFLGGFFSLKTGSVAPYSGPVYPAGASDAQKQIIDKQYAKGKATVEIVSNTGLGAVGGCIGGAIIGGLLTAPTVAGVPAGAGAGCKVGAMWGAGTSLAKTSYQQYQIVGDIPMGTPTSEMWGEKLGSESSGEAMRDGVIVGLGGGILGRSRIMKNASAKALQKATDAEKALEVAPRSAPVIERANKTKEVAQSIEEQAAKVEKSGVLDALKEGAVAIKDKFVSSASNSIDTLKNFFGF